VYAGFNAVFRNLAVVRLLQRYDAARESDRERLQKQLEVEKMKESNSSATGKVEIRWLGHACFLITAGDGTRILTDPFDDTVGYDLPTVPADIVTVSHAHFDHSNVGVVQGSPEVMNSPGDRWFGGVRIRGVQTCHDTKGGALRGNNIVFIIETDDIAICHAGDLGHVPSDETAKSIGRVDVLLIPVGGTYTLDAKGAHEAVRKLDPRIVIPMHYKTPDLKMTELDSAERFLAGLSRVERTPGSSYTVQASSLPRELTAVVLGYRK
jgi:L-ascorbate metabolism protein UlaG (beta-lactamase superfamily)